MSAHREISFEATYSSDTAAADAQFTTDKSKTDTPTISINSVPRHVYSGYLTDIILHIDWTNAVTLDEFIVFSGAVAGNHASVGKIIYEMPAALLPADNDEVHVNGLNRSFVLDSFGTFYYITNWSGAPGNCEGVISLKGRCFV